MFPVPDNKNVGNFQRLRADYNFGHFYCQGLGTWTALDNNSADLLNDVVDV